MKNVIAIALLLLTLAESVHACQRCGLFGRNCRVVAAPVQKQVAVVQQQYSAPVAYATPTAVVQAPVYQPPPIYVTNVYPDPNGAAGLIAKQGSSIYGFQQAAQAYFVNPAEVLRQAAELSKAATATASLGLSGFNQTAQTQLTLQASIAEPLAQGQAAAEVLSAAGLSHSTSRGESVVLKLTSGVAVNEHTTPQRTATATADSILATKCASCHGTALTEPKGGLYFDGGHPLDRQSRDVAIEAVMNGSMPKDGALTDAEKLKVISELYSLKKETLE